MMAVLLPLIKASEKPRFIQFSGRPGITYCEPVGAELNDHSPAFPMIMPACVSKEIIQ